MEKVNFIPASERTKLALAKSFGIVTPLEEKLEKSHQEGERWVTIHGKHILIGADGNIKAGNLGPNTAKEHEGGGEPNNKKENKISVKTDGHGIHSVEHKGGTYFSKPGESKEDFATRTKSSIKEDHKEDVEIEGNNSKQENKDFNSKLKNKFREATGKEWDPKGGKENFKSESNSSKDKKVSDLFDKLNNEGTEPSEIYEAIQEEFGLNQEQAEQSIINHQNNKGQNSSEDQKADEAYNKFKNNTKEAFTPWRTMKKDNPFEGKSDVKGAKTFSSEPFYGLDATDHKNIGQIGQTMADHYEQMKSQGVSHSEAINKLNKQHDGDGSEVWDTLSPYLKSSQK